MDPFYPPPRGWGKSYFVDMLRAAESAPKPEPTIWFDSRGRMVLDVYLNWEQRENIVHVDVKMSRGGKGYEFSCVEIFRAPQGFTKADRARALRAYGDMAALKLGHPWRPRGKL